MDLKAPWEGASNLKYVSVISPDLIGNRFVIIDWLMDLVRRHCVGPDKAVTCKLQSQFIYILCYMGSMITYCINVAFKSKTKCLYF